MGQHKSPGSVVKRLTSSSTDLVEKVSVQSGAWKRTSSFQVKVWKPAMIHRSQGSPPLGQRRPRSFFSPQTICNLLAEVLGAPKLSTIRQSSCQPNRSKKVSSTKKYIKRSVGHKNHQQKNLGSQKIETKLHLFLLFRRCFNQPTPSFMAFAGVFAVAPWVLPRFATPLWARRSKSSRSPQRISEKSQPG